MTRKEMEERGWEALDVLLVSGDAYVDHPSFGIALIARHLEDKGFRVGIVAQPRWENPSQALEDVSAMGRPRLFAGISAGAVDSMLAHYTAFRKKRHDDAYTPGGQAGARPNRATIMYTGLVRQAFPGIAVVLGGIEASLRRISHYDFWTDSVRRSILFDSKADLLVYGMGEHSILGIAQKAQEVLAAQEAQEFTQSAAAKKGVSGGEVKLDRTAFVTACHSVAGIGFLVSSLERAGIALDHAVQLPAHEEILENPPLLMQATLALEKHVHTGGTQAVQSCGGRFLVLNPPAPSLSEGALDHLYALPWSRQPHPSYVKNVPAWEMIRTSITTHRGCGGGCSFCSLALHQGRHIASRSKSSILEEASSIAAGGSVVTKKNSAPPRWAGSISDVGGPSANMWQAHCTLAKGKECARPSCMHPAICPFFVVDQKAGVSLLRAVNELPAVRHVRVASGVRFDLALRDDMALAAYTSEFTGGQLKVAPEHSVDAVLSLMRKPSMVVFEQFLEAFHRHSGKAGKEQYTIPYLMSAFPGCTEGHMRELAGWLRKKNWQPQQVQCFIPTPGTVATAMYYAKITPTGEPLYVARSDKERLRQHYLLTGQS